MKDTINEKYTKSREENNDIYSKIVRTRRRTYFFDVKTTKENDYYLVITESRKREREDGTVYYAKNKTFLFTEDFDKYLFGLEDAINYVRHAKSDAFLEPEPEYAEINAYD